MGYLQVFPAKCILTNYASCGTILGRKVCEISSIAAASLPFFYFRRGNSRSSRWASSSREHLYSCSLAERPCIKLFRINTCKSLSKQTTLTPFRMNTYEKHGGWASLLLTRHSSKGVWSRLPSNVHTIPQSAGFGRRAIRDRSIARRSGIPCAPPSSEFLRLGIYASFPSRWSRLRPA